MNKKYRYELPTTIFFLVALFVVLLDQITKTLVRTEILTGTSMEIIPKLFYLTHTTNTGASFSLLTGYSFLLTIIASLVVLAILFFHKKIPKEYKCAFAFILGGTAGNLIDRLWFGTVTDFIDVRIWPIFNIADSAITVAAILLIIAVFQEEKDMAEK